MTYTAIHQRLYRRYGKAKDYPCSDCGDQAKHWAYDHGDETPLYHDGVPYSTDLCRYKPLCVPCHKVLDLSHLTTWNIHNRNTGKPRCDHGHDFTAENTSVIVDRGGRTHRECRECHRRRNREYARKRRAAAR